MIVIAAAGYVAYRTLDTSSPIPPGEGIVPQEPAASSTEPEANGSQTATQGSSGPSILTTPYSVYLGFASEFGTSSEAVLKEEVPKTVIGYEWESLGIVMFDSVVLPAWDPNSAGEYEVSVWNEESNTYEALGTFSSGEEVQFPRNQLEGPRRFKVMGIDPALRICPGDRSFNWSVKFTFNADMGLVRTPITQDLLTLPPENCRMRQ